MNDFAVELYDVVKVYAGRRGSHAFPAVDQVSLHVRQGEFFTLLGPSGCGKTTTLRLIAGFETPTSGELLIQGQPMNRVPPYARPVNTVFQNYALFPHLTVAQNVGFGLAVRRVPRPERQRRVAEALELVRLPEIGSRKTWQLSGGQQQRVALARALVNHPAVLLLDEPLGALDLKLRKEMQLELKHLQSKVGITFIYVTHDQEEALTMSDRIAVMCHGRVLQVADPVTIYEHPATRFVADFIGETNFVAATVNGLGDGLAWLSLVGCTLAATVNGTALHTGQGVTCAVRPEKIMLHSVDDQDSPALRGVIREVVYIGTDTRYVVTLASAETIVARVQNVRGRGLGEFRVGQEVAVSWLPEDARVLLDDGIAAASPRNGPGKIGAGTPLHEKVLGS